MVACKVVTKRELKKLEKIIWKVVNWMADISMIQVCKLLKDEENERQEVLIKAKQKE